MVADPGALQASSAGTAINIDVVFILRYRPRWTGFLALPAGCAVLRIVFKLKGEGES